MWSLRCPTFAPVFAASVYLLASLNPFFSFLHKTACAYSSSFSLLECTCAPTSNEDDNQKSLKSIKANPLLCQLMHPIDHAHISDVCLDKREHVCCLLLRSEFDRAHHSGQQRIVVVYSDIKVVIKTFYCSIRINVHALKFHHIKSWFIHLSRDLIISAMRLQYDNLLRHLRLGEFWVRIK